MTRKDESDCSIYGIKNSCPCLILSMIMAYCNFAIKKLQYYCIPDYM